MKVTSEQIRAGRSLVKMEQRKLSEISEVPVQTLKRYEGGSGPVKGSYESVTAIVSALEDAGVVFIPENGGGAGVRLKKADGGE